jgi:hypothetical protein
MREGLDRRKSGARAESGLNTGQLCRHPAGPTLRLELGTHLGDARRPMRPLDTLALDSARVLHESTFEAIPDPPAPDDVKGGRGVSLLPGASHGWSMTGEAMVLASGSHRCRAAPQLDVRYHAASVSVST